MVLRTATGNDVNSVSIGDEIKSGAVVIAIDGPAGSGKSTVARQLAQRLGFTYVDTGAMYRAVGLLAMRSGVSLNDAAALERIAQTSDLHFVPDSEHLLSGTEDLTDLIRSPEVSHASSVVSTVPGVRGEMVAM